MSAATVDIDDPSLIERLHRMAKEEQTSLEELVASGLREYISSWDERRLEQEMAAFEQIRATVEVEHAGQWIAVCGGSVIDSDTDSMGLRLRVKATLGWWPVLYVQIPQA